MSSESSIDILKKEIASGKLKGQELIDKKNDLGWELSRINPQEAYELSLENYDEATEAKYVKGQVESLRNVAQCQRLFSDYPGSLETSLKALNQSEGLKQDSLKAEILNLIGAIYMHQGEPGVAVEYYSQCLDINKNNNDKEGVLKSMNSIGDLYLRQKEYHKALQIFNDCLKIGSENRTMIGIVTYNIGEVYFYLNQYDQALDYLNKAIKIGEDLNFTLMTVYCEGLIGEIYQKQNKVQEATAHLNVALDAAKKVEAKDRIYRCHKLLSSVYKKEKQFEMALEHFEAYHNTKESLYNEENTNKIKHLQFQYETEAIRRENEIEKKKNQELQVAYGKIEAQNENITSSINYASRIQGALLPGDKVLSQNLEDYFILYQPKDIVSGDFYWFNKVNEKIFFAAVDCTGHGVPGAFMSIVGNNGLNLAALQLKDSPDKMLDYLNVHVSDTLKETEDRPALNDGMDIGICSLDKKNRTIEFSGAYNPMYVITKDQKIISDHPERVRLSNHEYAFLEFKGSKTPIGNTRLKQADKKFECIELEFEDDAIIYLISDGYADQFGGENNTKFTYRRLRELLFELFHEPMNKQKEILTETLQKWIGEHKQIDDVCIFGVRV